MNRQASLLVVDDNEPSRDALSRRLQQGGYLVKAAGGGAEALALAAREPFDLVLLDVEMPVVSGLDVLAELRVKRSRTELPVIMVTARTEGSDIVEAFRLGANDHVTADRFSGADGAARHAVIARSGRSRTCARARAIRAGDARL